MSADADELARLRRRAYGPGVTAEERATAAAALGSLAAQSLLESENARKAEADAARAELPVIANSETSGQLLVAEQVSIGAGAEAGAGAAGSDGDGRPRHSVAAIWVVPIVVVALGLGALGALAGTGQLGLQPTSDARSESPTPTPSADPIVEPSLGDLDAVDKLFASEYELSDVYPDSEILAASFIHPEDVRFLVKKMVGVDEVRIWAAKTHPGELCLLAIIDTDGMSATSCTSREEFAKYGIAFGANDVFVSWNGSRVIFG